ncbi:YdiU family protein [Lujinxingia litoralis]|uniref:Protein nucleotidyltransferase YdiU n=1 Tax=Lujinxingia litoralis TaxID=2211119 RepID=A0A328C2U3_9DELT|nr:YdiU family protein [Lujinxingia litoralis]RAL20107.1 YdiU family protein [Lujinxingia litoralis]
MSSITFDDRFMRELPADARTDRRPRQVQGACYSEVEPSAVADPSLVACWPEVAELVGFDEAFVRSERFGQVMAGNALLEGMKPYAACYGGHQFGNWAGQLGDGRAITLGEAIHPETGARHELQLKGAGPTPYSRSADGRAVLRSSIREFLCSEAMFHLGVPTTRALSLVLTGEQVMRDKLYDGRPAPEPGAVVCRVAPSFLRFGSFEIHAARGDLGILRGLVEHTIRHYFPHLLARPDEAISEAHIIAWLREVGERTAEMVVGWMRVGFVHGVMNTDNMSILGLTIDYGPYGWLDNFDPGFTPNTTDRGQRRYRYGYQPDVAYWNLYKLTNAVAALVDDAAPLQEALDHFPTVYSELQLDMMAQKLGLTRLAGAEDEVLVEGLMAMLGRVETDYTLFYRGLAEVRCEGVEADAVDAEALRAPLMAAYYAPESHREEDWEAIDAWLRAYVARVQNDGTSDVARREAMNAVNPMYILRNYLAQEAIDQAEQGDFSKVHELMAVLRHPYQEQAGRGAFGAKRPEWARDRFGCSMLSCSS